MIGVWKHPDYPMTTLEDARESMLQAARDYRAGVLDDFTYADVRAMLHDAMARMENERIPDAHPRGSAGLDRASGD